MYLHELVPSRGIVTFPSVKIPKGEKRPQGIREWTKSILEVWAKNITDFANLTSIHGAKHFTYKDRHPVEHLVWVCFLAAALGGALTISASTWRRYQDNPTVISMERDYKQWNTSVPAGTLCPHIRVEPKALTRTVHAMTVGWADKDRQVLKSFIADLSNVSYANFQDLRRYADVSPSILPPPEDYLRLIDEVKMELKYDVSSSLENMHVHATRTVTELGVCWAFNAPLAAYNAYSYWKSGSYEILPDVEVMQCYPLVGEVYMQVTNLNSGYQLHAPTEVMDVARRTHNSPPDFYMTLDMTALSIYNTEESKRLSPGQRRCRLPEESNLALGPAYSYSLCRVQCRMMLAYSLCACVPHFYRPLNGYKICDVRGLLCLSEHAQTLIKLRNDTTNQKIPCHCLPACDDVTYISEKDSIIAWDLGTNLKWGITRYPRMRLKKDILFGFTDLLVSIGGTVGLFLGCSLLGLLEVAYFFTLRVFLSINALYHRANPAV